MAVEYRGVKFNLKQGEAGFWRWRMQVGDRTITGKVKANLKLLAERRVRIRIDVELRKLRAKAEAAASKASPETP